MEQAVTLDLIAVEDSAVDVELIVDALREAGLTLQVRAVDEESAFHTALDQRLPDAILADWTLPLFSGGRALEIASVRCPEIPFIFVSGTISEASALDGLRHGAIDYVYKHQLQRLVPVLKRAIVEARTKRSLRESEERYRLLNAELESRIQERTRQLLDAQEELVRKEKLAVLGQVAGSVGHELRSPLGVMNNAVYILEGELADADHRVKEYLSLIRTEIESSERIVSDLLDSVRTSPPRLEAVSARELIDQTLRKCSVPPTVTVKLEVPESLASLLVDARQMQQVFRNLISNGVEAMPDGGTLEISAIENGTNGTVTVCVRDSGCGMTREQLGNLFQPLFTTKARGTGLGLVVVKNLVQANGGTVNVESETGMGTVFAVTLPAQGHSEG